MVVKQWKIVSPCCFQHEELLMICRIVVLIAVSSVCLMVGSEDENNLQDMVVMVVLTISIISS